MAGKAGLPGLIALVIALGLPGACEREPQREPQRGFPSAQPPSAASPAPDPAAPVVLALGDSLTAGLGLPESQSYPALLQARLAAAGYPHRVVNAGVSGDTSAGGLARLDWLLRQQPDVIILALGANDGLRGVPPRVMRENLANIIERAQGAGVRVLLAGMRLPGNYGADFTRRFEAVFAELARRYKLPPPPFLLEGVAMRGGLNQADGIHPNAAGTAIVTDNVWRALEPLLEK